MNLIKNIPFAIAFLGLIILAFLQVVIHVRFVLSLKKRHPELWNMLGCPAPFLGNTPKQCLELTRFIRRRMYLDTNDTVMLKQGGLLRVFTRIYLVYFIMVAFMFVMSVIVRFTSR